MSTPTLEWSEAARRGVTETHAQVTTARAVTAAGTVIDLAVESLRIGWDETRSPRCTASLTVRVPDDQAVLDALDPRAGVRVVIEAGYVLADGIREVTTVADLGLRARSASRPASTLSLDAGGDEALLIDTAPSVGYDVTGTSAGAAIASILATKLPGSVVQGLTDYGPAVPATRADDAERTMRDIADRAGLDVYDDGLRTWRVEMRPTTTSDSVHLLKVGPGGTVLASDTDLTRDAWANRVVLRYRWRDDAGDEYAVVAVRSVATGPLAPATAGVRALDETRDTPTTQAAADAAADALLHRMASRGRSFTVRAVAAWWLRPGHTVTVQLPTGPQERHLVSRVEFDAGAAVMTVTTRLPVDIDTTGE